MQDRRLRVFEEAPRKRVRGQFLSASRQDEIGKLLCRYVVIRLESVLKTCQGSAERQLLDVEDRHGARILGLTAAYSGFVVLVVVLVLDLDRPQRGLARTSQQSMSELQGIMDSWRQR